MSRNKHKTANMKFNHYYMDLFGINLYWFRGSREKYNRLVKGEFDQKAPDKGPSVKGTFEVYKKDGIWISVIWLSNHSFELLAHECFHAVHWCLQDRGLNLTDASEEAYAYFLQALIKEMK